jgi:hypothetical protein
VNCPSAGEKRAYYYETINNKLFILNSIVNINREREMSKEILMRLFIFLMGLASLLWGVHGVKNRKHINDLPNFILSIGQIGCGIIIFLGIILKILVEIGII